MERLHTALKYHSSWYARHLRPRFKAVAGQNGTTIYLPDGYDQIWEMPEEVREGNILVDTGEIAILSAFFATTMSNYGAPPANIYLALDSRSSLAETDGLDEVAAAELTLGAKGYERKALSTAGTGANGQDFYINQPAAYYRADSKIVEWTATDNWVTAQKNLDLVTDATALVDGAGDHLIASKALSADRTLLTGDKLQASMYIGLSE